MSTSYDEWAKPQVACINCGVEYYMWLLTKMVIFLTMYFVGLLIMFNYPEEHELGIILSFGGLLLFGLTIAQAHIKSLE